MDRAEATGFGVAAAGHVVLLGVLSLGFASAVQPPIMNEPMEVSFVEDIGLESAAPAPSQAEAAPKLAEVEGPPEPAPLPEPDPDPLPRPKAIEPVPAPKALPLPKAVTPAPKPAERPKPPKPAPAKAKEAPKRAPPRPAPAAKAAAAKAAKPTGNLAGLLDGIGERETKSRSTTPPARTASAAALNSLNAEVLRQLRPHWRPPTGADVERLRTEINITLARNGSATNIEIADTTGQTESNQPQIKLHREQAVKAVKLASPFRLPPEYYDEWKQLTVGFDARLTR